MADPTGDPRREGSQPAAPPSRGQAARRRLLDAAVELLAERGLERVNSNQIAKAAGVGVGTFYAHFPDKYAIQQAVVLEVLEQLGERVEAAARQPAPDRASQVRRSVEAALDFAVESPGRFRAAFAHEIATSPGRPGIAPSPRRLERRLRGLQVQGRLDPELDPAVAAKGFTSMQTAVILWWLDDPARAERTHVIETLVRLHPAVAAAR
ncbi:MAG: TetR/AcrR family transcriptional regulator [Myxococcota bacterium]